MHTKSFSAQCSEFNDGIGHCRQEIGSLILTLCAVCGAQPMWVGVCAQVTGHGHLYSGVMDCLRKTVAAEGLRGLYKGWLPNWLRIG